MALRRVRLATRARSGIARAMVRALLADPALATLRRWCLATRDAHGVYAACGFAPVDARPWMEHKPDPSAWSERRPSGAITDTSRRA